MKSSFEFIAECLLPYAGRYYTIPGKPHGVSADIRADLTADNRITAVFVGGRDVLRSKDDDDPLDRWRGRKYSKEELKQKLSEEMLVPVAPSNGDIQSAGGAACFFVERSGAIVK